MPISSLFSDEDRITPTCRLNRLIVLALTVSFPPNAAVHCDRVASWKEQPGATGTSPRVCLTLQGVGGQKICNGLLVVNKYRQPCFPTTTPIAKRLLPAHTHTWKAIECQGQRTAFGQRALHQLIVFWHASAHIHSEWEKGFYKFVTKMESGGWWGQWYAYNRMQWYAKC